MTTTHQLVIACATVMEEILPVLPPDVGYRVLDFGMHANPENLRATLQRTIDESGDSVNTIILGYGLCSLAVVGLRATNCTLVVPRVDDCISIFLGSRSAFQQQFDSEPGTYYLTKGWIEAGNGPFDEYERLAAKHGPKRAEEIVRLMLQNYTRLAFINTGQHRIPVYRQYAKRIAERWGLRYEEIPGSTRLVKKMVYGPWDEEFILARPGEMIQYEHFFAERTMLAQFSSEVEVPSDKSA